MTMKLSLPAIFSLVLLLCLVQACKSEAQPETAQQPRETLRVATFNIAMGLPQQGDMAEALSSGNDPRLVALAAVLQKTRPDIVLLNEFDYDPAIDAANLLNRSYLENASSGFEPISYGFSYRPAVNTGMDSALDLDSDGALGEPEDAWGYGAFPGQYGMLILSRYPIVDQEVRSFQTLRWAELPNALEPFNQDGTPFYPVAVWSEVRLSSKNHVDVPVQVGQRVLHLLASHPTPPVFDGPEDRNGNRNHDELAFWVHYLDAPQAGWIRDDNGIVGGFDGNAPFVIAGDLNADPADGEARPGAIAQLLEHPAVNSNCVPTSLGGTEAAELQGGVNLNHSGDPAADTSDFSDESVGNYRLDYVLPSRGLRVRDCGVLWPTSDSDFHATATFSDHRLVWIDIEL